jgi:hypothetical protein
MNAGGSRRILGPGVHPVVPVVRTAAPACSRPHAAQASSRPRVLHGKGACFAYSKTPIPLSKRPCVAVKRNSPGSSRGRTTLEPPWGHRLDGLQSTQAPWRRRPGQPPEGHSPNRSMHLMQLAPADCGWARPNLRGSDARGHTGVPRRRLSGAVGCGCGPEPAAGEATRGRQPCPARRVPIRQDGCGGAPSSSGVREACRGARMGTRWCSRLHEVHRPIPRCPK